MLLLPNAGKYKCLLQGKGLQIQINNKTIIIIRVLTVSLFYIGNFGGGGGGGNLKPAWFSFSEFWVKLLNTKGWVVYQIEAIKKLYLV